MVQGKPAGLNSFIGDRPGKKGTAGDNTFIGANQRVNGLTQQVLSNVVFWAESWCGAGS